MFSDDESGRRWVCPNVTVATVNNRGTTSAEVVTCEEGEGAVYAANETCDSSSTGKMAFFVYVRLVSSNVDANIYF